MTPRERFLQTMLFGTPDRIPYQFGQPRESTLNAWYRQGLPRGIHWDSFVGHDAWETVPLNFQALPAFEPVVIEEDRHHKTWIDEMGVKRVDHKKLPTPGFVTRTYLDFPVKNRSDFQKMIQRFNPNDPGRLPVDWDTQRRRFAGAHDFVLGMIFPSVFWKVRDWVGFHRICELVYDDPTLLQDMMHFVADFTIEATRRVLVDCQVDYVYFNEDMCYKTASMISPDHVRQFMWPCYRKIVRHLRQYGVSVLIMDSDGCVGDLLPLWIDAGINAIGPVEIAAGNDPIAYRRRFGRNLAMVGAIDKRELRFDPARARGEVMGKVPWLIEQGGYIPGCDHGVPPDIPVRTFLYTCELIKEIACGGRLDVFEPPCELERQLGAIEEMWHPDMALPADDDDR